jgi:hypothetical protein
MWQWQHGSGTQCHTVWQWQCHTIAHSGSRSKWQSQHGSMAVAAWQWQHGSGSVTPSHTVAVAVAAWQWQWQLGSAPPVAVSGGSYLSVSILRGRATPASVSVTQG